ncbi:hypothetical protein SmJEL517_g04178 [Synchytrium microbalum]|uniref:Nuclear condensin complex subunit 3 C-terminal domain-containing protein n=1 Tax=Synchytrium microbalum TaxID=1806994 RepID=A0A507C5P2_9FUNG|nr:uncharacterized protein SmJEL517_g04178 [Synchytrium microbalum]TPX32785.1 hypothetical protein SmJEL517_g04178 [Synchytrium microbalum]
MEVGKIFQEAQSTAGHSQRKHVKALFKQYTSNVMNNQNHGRAATEFAKTVWAFLTMILLVKKGESAAERIVHLFAAFLDQLNPANKVPEDEDASDDEEDLKQQEAKSQFVEYLVAQLSKGIASKDKTVRYRVCQLLAVCISHLDELDDDIFADLQRKLVLAAHDKEASVRAQAALALCKFQSGDDDADWNIQTSLLELMRVDTSAEVRKTILWNIHTTARTLPYILERARDTDTQVRKLVFSKIVADIEDMSILTIASRDRLLDCGLRDRDSGVRSSCLKMLGQSWIKQAEDNLLVFLSRLDVVSSSGAEEALKAFFLANPDVTAAYDDYLWDNLTVDSAFLIRVHAQFHAESQEYDAANDILPDLSKHVTHINKYIGLMNDANDDEDRVYYEFIVGQLLLIALSQDFSDEAGRRKMFECLRSTLANVDLPLSSIQTSVKVLSRIALNDQDFLRVILELLYGIADPDEPADTDEGIYKMRKCLDILRCMFEVLDTDRHDLASFQPFLQYYIMPAVQSRDEELRQSGLRCLALYCMLDKQVAVERMPLFLYAYQHGDGTMRQDGLEAAFDLVTLHGLAVFAEVESPDGDDLVKLLEKSLQAQEPELATIAAEGICKLVMLKTVYNATILEVLVLLYFHPETAENPRLRQCLSYFFPVFFHASSDHRRLLAEIFISSMRTMLELHQTYKDDMVGPLPSAQQMIEWLEDTHGDSEETSCSIQPQIAMDLLDAISKEEAPGTARLFANVLNKLVIRPCAGTELINDLIQVSNQVQPMMTDTLVKNALKRFQSLLGSIGFEGHNDL